jgi:hypothetical protein
MSLVADEKVVTRLNSLGVPTENLFLLPGDGDAEGSIVLWHPEIGARFVVIENDELARACYAYLLGHGARRFASCQQFLEAAAAEKWPGWNTCEPALRSQKRP